MSHVKSELQWVVSLPVACSHCGYELFETVRTLTNRHSLPCGGCGRELDLRAGEVGVMLKKAAELCIGKFAPIAQVKQ